jgi:hypothetical protein
VGRWPTSVVQISLMQRQRFREHFRSQWGWLTSVHRDLDARRVLFDDGLHVRIAGAAVARTTGIGDECCTPAMRDRGSLFGIMAYKMVAGSRPRD